ncbi:Dabb family protein [Fontivita pretiosa]|uniref:Dabb family protein n=1 Tax=Fontivita pretiosa TaxID=2989684 RepID=UPI003D178013
MKRIRVVICAAMLLAGCGCWPAAIARPRPVGHVVICWLNQPGDSQARQKLIAASRSFQSIPGVVRVSAGRAIPSTRPVVDSSFDVAVFIYFRDHDALMQYEHHPVHRAAVEQVLKPLVARYVVYDFTDELRQ